MSAVSMPTPTTRASSRIIAWGSFSEAWSKRRLRPASISLKSQARHVSAHLSEGIRGQGRTLRRLERLKTLCGLPKRRLEIADAPAHQAGLHPIYDTGLLAN
jgi:hypothetical protein